MEDLALNQAYVFLIYILSGILIGILFDVFRVYRKSFKTPDILTYIQDILFWVITGIFLLYVIFKFSDGELRGYIFLGIFLGVLAYMLLFSKHFIKVNVSILKFIKVIFIKVFNILVIPLVKLRRILFKPISFVFINLRKYFKDLFKKFITIKSNKFIKKAKKSQ